MSVTATSVRTAAASCVARLRRVSHEDLQVGALFGWTAGPMLEVVEKYMESVKKYPNPHAPDLTNFKGR